MKRYATAGAALVSGLTVFACSNATSSDPATSERSALNPPSGLVSLTGDAKLTIQFSGANTEKDFQGYDVFVVANKKMADIAAGKKYYPANANIDPVAAVSQSIPRCKDNSAVFEAFGFPASTATCAGGGLSASSDAAASNTGLRLDDSTTTSSDDPAPTQFVVCDGETDKTVSKKLSKPILGVETCVITKLADGTALTNGTSYSIFVATVAGDKKNKLSWTSNFIQDTPAFGVYSDVLKLTPNTYTHFKSDNLTATTITKYATADVTSGTTCIPAVCTINTANTSLADRNEDGLYFGRLGNATATKFPARVLLSTSATGALKLLPRGPRLNTDANEDVVKDPPGLADDQAISDATVYDGSGTLYPVEGFQVFDLLVTNASTKVQHFGKIIIGQPSVSGDPTAATSTVSLPVSIIMQPQAGSTDYFTLR